MRSAASLGELLSQQREIRRRVKADGGNETDTMTQVQIERTASLSTAELTTEARSLGRRATRGRTRLPGPMGRMIRIPVEVGPLNEVWSLGYLNDIILTRDTWMHRVDLVRAIGSDMVLTADHDGRIVADVVAEWATRHGKPFVLTLTGPAGRMFTAPGSEAPETITVDAVEFCRIVSARADGPGLLGQFAPF